MLPNIPKDMHPQKKHMILKLYWIKIELPHHTQVNIQEKVEEEQREEEQREEEQREEELDAENKLLSINWIII